MEVALKSERRLAPWLKHVNMMSPLRLRLGLTTNRRRRHCAVDGHDHRAMWCNITPAGSQIPDVYLASGWHIPDTLLVLRLHIEYCDAQSTSQRQRRQDSCLTWPRWKKPAPDSSGSTSISRRILSLTSGTVCGVRATKSPKRLDEIVTTPSAQADGFQRKSPREQRLLRQRTAQRLTLAPEGPVRAVKLTRSFACVSRSSVQLFRTSLSRATRRS
jgi:hypothetical protein